MSCIALSNINLTRDFAVGFNAAHRYFLPKLLHEDPKVPGVWFLNVDPTHSWVEPALALYQSGLLLLNVVQTDPLQVYDTLQPDVVLVVEDMAIQSKEALRATRFSFPDVQVKAEVVQACIHRLEITASAGLVRALQVFLCFAMAEHCATVDEKKALLHHNRFLDRHIYLLNQANAPYLMRHLLARDIVPYGFKNFQADLEKRQMREMRVKVGDRTMALYDELSAHVKSGEYLVEIDCTNGALVTMLAGDHHKVRVYESSPEVREWTEYECQKNGQNNVEFGGQFTPALIEEIPPRAHVLLNNALVRMPMAEARDLLLALRASKAKEVILTVPNNLFNRYYGLPHKALRDPSHRWEPSYDSFRTFLRELFDHWSMESEWRVDCFGLGDAVDRVPASMLAVISKKTVPVIRPVPVLPPKTAKPKVKSASKKAKQNGLLEEVPASKKKAGKSKVVATQASEPETPVPPAAPRSRAKRAVTDKEAMPVQKPKPEKKVPGKTVSKAPKKRRTVEEAG